MSSPSIAKIAANQANAQHSTGPRTEEGRAASAQNATKSGLFAAKDFIRPGEQVIYNELNADLLHDLAPQGQLEHHYVEELRRAMWRLRRCGEVEASMVDACAPDTDAMQNEATAKLQTSVDRARAQCHRLINRSTAELRKLQTERHVRNEITAEGTDLSHLGLCDYRAVRKANDEDSRTAARQIQRESRLETALFKDQLERAYGPQPGPLPVAKQTHHAQSPDGGKAEAA